MSETISLLILWARSKNSESWYGKMTLEGIMDLTELYFVDISNGLE
jgi:hypothetical protein